MSLDVKGAQHSASTYRCGMCGRPTDLCIAHTRVDHDINLRGMVVQILLMYAPFRVMHRGVAHFTLWQPDDVSSRWRRENGLSLRGAQRRVNRILKLT